MNPKRLLLLMLASLFSFTVLAQDRVVTGRITDAAGLPLVGASVQVKGTTIGTTTNTDGAFSLKVPSTASTLVVTSVGYTQQEVTIGTSAMNVTLQSAAGNLNEVVVVGYGTQRRRDVTGAVATVTSKDFQTGAIQSPEQLIAGKVAGVQVIPSSGAPGGAATIRIRGGASLNASNDPLIVIDGVPVAGGVSGSANPLNMINPDDIESFNILKDPSAAAIYGSRASNGVILITTRKGRKGAPQWNAAVQVFSQSPTKTVDVLSADQIRSLVYAKTNKADSAKVSKFSTDWQDEIFRTAFGQDITLSVSGAAINGKLPYRVSGGFLNQDGILKTSNFKRQSLALNLTPRFLDDQLKVEINIKGARTTNRFADEGAIGSAIGFDPTQPVRVDTGQFGGYFEYTEGSQVWGTMGYVPKNLAPRNPLSLLEMRKNKSEVYRLLSNIQLDYSLPWVKGLRANMNVGYDYQTGEGNDWGSPNAAAFYGNYKIDTTFGKYPGHPWANADGRMDSVYNYGGFNNDYKSKAANLLFDFYLNYARDIKSINSRIDVMGGYGYQDVKYTNYNFPSRRADRSIITTPQFEVDYPQFTLISYYGRLNYTLLNRYTLTVNVRTDGTSKFSKDGRWGFFPSVAGAWRIKDERFLANSNTISELKLRASYGITGQQEGFAFYGYIPRYQTSENTAHYQLGNTFYSMNRPIAYDPGLTWETTENTGFGLDFGLFRNRISGSIDVFKRKTKDLLSVVPVALGTNFNNELLTNVGNIESEGFEVNLNVIPVVTKDFNWDVNFNFTYVEPKITNLLFNPDPTYIGQRFGGITGGTGNNMLIHSIGYAPGSFFVLKQVYDQFGKPLEGVYEDMNRDGIINEKDYYRFKSNAARYYLGFTTNFSYQKWSLGMVFRGSIGNYVYNNVFSNLGVERGIFNPLGWINNGSTNYLETGFKNNQYFSDYYVENASFLRMDNLSLGYNAGKVFKNATLRISANVQNVFVITKYRGMDPEVGAVDYQFYPRPRIYTLGLNLGF